VPLEEVVLAQAFEFEALLNVLATTTSSPCAGDPGKLPVQGQPHAE